MSEQKLSSKFVWSVWGCLFGLCFPIIAVGIRLFQLGGSETLHVISTDPLLWIIITAPVFLGAFAFLGGWQNDKVREFSNELELKVIDRTQHLNSANAKLQQQSKNQQTLLAGLSEGVFYFDKSGSIADERSPALEKILPGSKELGNAIDFFAEFSGISSKDTAQVIESLWDKEFLSPFESTAKILGKEVVVEHKNEQRIVRFEYKEQNDHNDQLDKVIVFVNDITEQREAERRQNIMAERIKRISLAASNFEGFRDFRTEAINLLKNIDEHFSNENSDLNSVELKRNLHTLKGITATFEFSSLATTVHEIEGLIANDSKIDNIKVKNNWEILKDQWKFEISDIEEVLGLQKQENYIRIVKKKYKDFGRAIFSKNDLYLTSKLINLTEYPPTQVLGRYSQYITAMATKRDKTIHVAFTPDSDEISFEVIKKIDNALVHLLKNCVDHGIESHSEREKVGKMREGKILIGCYKKDNMLHLTIKDDGRGINTETLARKATELKIWENQLKEKATFQEKINLIFLPMVSTANKITETSGRGIGMNAVKKIIEGLGGKISVYSEFGSGTQFEIDVPIGSDDISSCLENAA